MVLQDLFSMDIVCLQRGTHVRRFIYFVCRSVFCLIKQVFDYKYNVSCDIDFGVETASLSAPGGLGSVWAVSSYSGAPCILYNYLWPTPLHFPISNSHFLLECSTSKGLPVISIPVRAYIQYIKHELTGDCRYSYEYTIC